MRTILSLVGLSLALLVGCGADEDAAGPVQSQLSQAQTKEPTAANGSQAGYEKEVLMSEDVSATDEESVTDRFFPRCRDFRCDRYCRHFEDCRGGFCSRHRWGENINGAAAKEDRRRRHFCRCFGCY